MSDFTVALHIVMLMDSLVSHASKSIDVLAQPHYDLDATRHIYIAMWLY